MALTTSKIILLAAGMAARLQLGGQQNDLKSKCDTKSGLLTPTLGSRIDVQVVTTETVPGREGTALSGPEAQFPVMVVPTSGTIGGGTLADGATRGMNTQRQRAEEAGPKRSWS